MMNANERDEFERLIKVETSLLSLEKNNEQRFAELKVLIAETSLAGIIKANKLISYPLIFILTLNAAGFDVPAILSMFGAAKAMAWFP